MSLESTIKISPEARDALKDIGRKGESYDAVIRRLIKYWVLEELYEGASRILDLLGEPEEASG